MYDYRKFRESMTGVIYSEKSRNKIKLNFISKNTNRGVSAQCGSVMEYLFVDEWGF